MRFSLPALAIQRPITVTMLVITCIGLGVIAAQRIAIEFMPPMDLPFLGAFVPNFGATPEQVEQEIAIPAEGEFRTLPGLRRLRTSSSEQGCFIGMRFEWGTDMSEALAEVRDRMERLRLVLPDNVDRIYVRHFSLETIPIMQLGLASDGDHLAFTQRVRNDLLPRITRLPGVAEVQMFGADEPTVMVDLDQQALISRGISIYELIGKLQVSNVNTGIGEVVDADREYHVRVQSELKTVDDYARLQLRPELQLQDVARGAMRSREREQRFAIDGEQEVFLMITKESEANAAATCERVIEELERVLATPEFAGAKYFTFFSQGDVINGALNGLKKASAYGGAMAVLVLFMFLRRIRPTLVVALTIPGSLVIGLIVLYALGMSLNLVTMMSLIIAVGMVVDNAIVVIENIYRHHDLGADAPTAARRGAEEVGLAIFASTSTTAVVFLPVFYIDNGQMSVFTRQFAVPVTTALAASLILALTVIPLAASRFKYYEDSWMERWRRRPEGRPSRLLAPIVMPVRLARAAYVGAMRAALRQRVAAVLLLFAVTAFTLGVPARQVGFQSLPSADRRYVDVRVEFDPNYDIRQAESFFNRVVEVVNARRDEFGVKHIFENYTARGGEMRLYLINEDDLAPGERLPFTSDQVMNVLWHLFPPEFPGGKISFATGMENAETGTSQSEVSLRLVGDETAMLRVQAERLISRLEALPGVLEAGTSAERLDPELRVKIDPQLAGMAGVNPTVAAQTVAFALQGTKLSTIKQGGREIEVWSQYSEMDRAGVSNLENIHVMTGGGSVPLNQFTHITHGRTPQTINRIDGKNYLWIQVKGASNDMREIYAQILGAVAGFDMPPGYRVAIGDELQNMQEDQANFASILLLAVVLIYIVMAALFESYLLPLSILTTVPLAFLGVYWAMFVTGTPMDTVAFIGCILMVGVVVNNGIVIVDRINQLRAAGTPRFEAIIEGGRQRLRPVLMTALTTILGAVPLAAGPPLGDAAAVSLGRAMIGGLIGGTLLTLFVVPLFYSLIDDFRAWANRFAADLLPSRNAQALKL